MSGRLTYMKYIAIVAVAVFSLLVAIPLSKQSAQPKIVSFKPVASKVAITPVVKPTATHQVAQAVVTQPTKPTAAPVAQPQPTATLASYTCQNYRSLFEQYNWNANTAMAICQAESSGNPEAVSNANINPDGVSDFGLMQLHGVDILDPASNIAYAYYHKYLTQGWGAWSTYNSGRYTIYL